MAGQLRADTQSDRRKRKFSFFACALLKMKIATAIWHICLCPQPHQPTAGEKAKEPNLPAHKKKRKLFGKLNYYVSSSSFNSLIKMPLELHNINADASSLKNTLLPTTTPLDFSLSRNLYSLKIFLKDKFLPALKISAGIFIFLLHTSFCIKSDYIKLIEATSKYSASGIKGGTNSTEYYFKIKILTEEKIDFDSLWIEKKVFNPFIANSKPSISNQAPTFFKNDTITLRVSDLQSKNSSSVATSPIKYKGSALLIYKVKDSSHYLVIKKIKIIQAVNRP